MEIATRIKTAEGKRYQDRDDVDDKNGLLDSNTIDSLKPLQL
jgi:hypothetical protein